MPNTEKKEEIAPLVLAEVERRLSQAAERLGKGRLKLIIAISGGEDSSVLLDVLSKTEHELIPAHVNHGLRSESEQEEEFVRELCAGYNLELSLKRLSPTLDRKNIEAWAREERYGYFSELHAEYQADFTLTAHHLNDQAETLLFRFLTARLATSAHCIAPLDLKRRVLRPLIGLTKAQIEQYAAENNIPYVYDLSNNDINFTRNRLRHHLLPQLRQEYNENLDSSLSVTAERLSLDEAYLWNQAEEFCRRGIEDVEQLMAAPEALRWRALGILVREKTGVEKLGFATLVRGLEFLSISTPYPRAIDLGFGAKMILEPNGTIKFGKSKHTR